MVAKISPILSMFNNIKSKYNDHIIDHIEHGTSVLVFHISGNGIRANDLELHMGPDQCFDITERYKNKGEIKFRDADSGVRALKHLVGKLKSSAVSEETNA